MPENFSACENFRNLRKFATWYCSSSPMQLFVSCNPPFDVPKIKFSNLFSQAINGH